MGNLFQQIDQPVKLKWFVVLICGIVLALQEVTLVPDSYELALLGECLWLGETSGISCHEVSWNFRPPGPAVLIGPLLPLMSGLMALRCLSLLSILVMVWVLIEEGEKLELRAYSALSVGALFSAPAWREMLSVNDARVLVLGFVFGAWSLALRAQTKGKAAAAGLLIAIAALIRPEQQLSLPLMLGLLFFIHRPRVGWAVLGAVVPLGAWVVALSIQAGRLMLMPRHWEGQLLGLVELIPLRWAQQLFGMGIWNTPFRQAATALPPSAQLSYNPIDWQAIATIIDDAFSLPLAALGMLFLFWASAQVRVRKVAVTALLLMLPTLLVSVMPQARDPLFPSSNIFPVVVLIPVVLMWGVSE